MEACKELTEMLRATGRYYYPQSESELSWKIEDYYYGNGGNTRIHCAIYVEMVLYYAGIFDAETINKPQYFNSVNGIRRMLLDAGWEEIPYSEAQPGDIGLFTAIPSQIHAFFMWENNTIWDECIGQKRDDGRGVVREGPWCFLYMDKAKYYRHT